MFYDRLVLRLDNLTYVVLCILPLVIAYEFLHIGYINAFLNSYVVHISMYSKRD